MAKKQRKKTYISAMPIYNKFAENCGVNYSLPQGSNPVKSIEGQRDKSR